MRAVALLVIALLPACVWAQGGQPAIIVSSDTISERAVLFQFEQDRCSHDSLASNIKAAVELVNIGLEHAVLKRAFGEEAPDSIVRSTAARLPMVTHDSMALACIYAIGDSASLLRYLVQPTLTNPRLYTRFYEDSNIHRESRDSIQHIFQTLIPHPEQFLTYSLDTIVVQRTGEQAAELGDLPLVKNVLSKLGPRKLWPRIIESETDCSIVMLDTVTDSTYRALAIRVEKRPFDRWFHNYVRQYIAIEFVDKRLEGAIRKHYPNLWWLPPNTSKL